MEFLSIQYTISPPYFSLLHPCLSLPCHPRLLHPHTHAHTHPHTQEVEEFLFFLLAPILPLFFSLVWRHYCSSVPFPGCLLLVILLVIALDTSIPITTFLIHSDIISFYYCFFFSSPLAAQPFPFSPHHLILFSHCLLRISLSPSRFPPHFSLSDAATVSLSLPPSLPSPSASGWVRQTRRPHQQNEPSMYTHTLNIYRGGHWGTGCHAPLA